ncbi:flagellar hook-associated protein 3 FlgL [Duganella sp. CF517]|uniref:flagellar hook-associated protein FlgL n=1 Tax=Duganella sp. CF517 TaxID=1881038 RepID=UPI0008B3D6E0|nr:flagellar hook-associated protein FlgL [Duganella sp. CF517]SEN14324.1 flagellar hook-associated protein 3 FlgL [Duganella sp. CF517]
MRIASSQFQATMNRGLQDNQSWVSKLTEQLASGDRIMLPSDDPIGAVRISRLTREEAIVDQYRQNIAATRIRLTSNEEYLSSMTRDITSLNDLLVQASDGSNSPADLKATVTSLTSLRDSLLYTANQKDQEGRYIFSGTETNTQPIQVTSAPGAPVTYGYMGNLGQQKTVIGNGITQTVNVDVDGLQNLLTKLSTTIEALSDPALVVGSATVRAALTDNMDTATATLDLVAGKIAQLGGAQNVMRTLDGNHANVSLSNKTAILELGQLDYAGALTELAGYNLSLEASYKAYSKVSNLSLFNVL